MNWQKTITDIQKHGLTQPQIADKCGCSQTTVSELFRGKVKEPRYTVGRSLVDLLKTLEDQKAALLAA